MRSRCLCNDEDWTLHIGDVLIEDELAFSSIR
jgi:hypothetical protein